MWDTRQVAARTTAKIMDHFMTVEMEELPGRRTIHAIIVEELEVSPEYWNLRARPTADIAALAREAAEKAVDDLFTDVSGVEIATLVQRTRGMIDRESGRTLHGEYLGGWNKQAVVKVIAPIILSVFTGDKVLVKQEEGTVASDVVEMKPTSELSAGAVFYPGIVDQKTFAACVGTVEQIIRDPRPDRVGRFRGTREKLIAR